ncbi:MAG: hypothetical protein GXO11_06290 [Epsilonproteobacteria bacterium]|nr:hypothetical protein [Campylobacterota bacterium]
MEVEEFKELLENINRAMGLRDYKLALPYLYTLYNYFYKKQVEFLEYHSCKQEVCESSEYDVVKWFKDYKEYVLDGRASYHLYKIEKFSKEYGQDFITAEGDNILEKTLKMRKHCNIFYNMRKKEKSKRR